QSVTLNGAASEQLLWDQIERIVSAPTDDFLELAQLAGLNRTHNSCSDAAPLRVTD
ncbi:MAG: hypothetical protein F6K09_12865, partial [Merismopedia sp. SIO2A8]|nr:hypothetical protein [Merismopedia sp. SIO2A8]